MEGNSSDYGDNGHDASTAKFDLGSMDYSLIQKLAICTVIVPIIVFIVVSNSLVIYAVFNHGPLKTYQNYFVASLAVTDLMMGSIVMPLALQYNLNGIWLLGQSMCKVGSY